MTLTIGTRLGPYEIVSPLGAGGMGEVYRARDTKLDRDVALKILPDLFASDPERLARFEREAKTLATLNHAHIAQIHGLEDSPSTGSGQAVRALVMELVEGEDLSHRIARGPIPIDEALAIARQIADALEAAHDTGIVHRDLKPANIKVTPDGKVKVLDFGLAKELRGTPGQVAAAAGAGRAGAIDRGATLTSPAYTAAGVILGTAAYMSPEQARGKPVDKRADMWAFGCIVYECLTGQQPFGGETISDSIGKVLEREPDWTALPPQTPAAIRVLLHRCLAKDPARRLRDAGDARLELEDAGSRDMAFTPVTSMTRGDRAPAWRGTLPWMLAGLFAMAAVWIAWQWRAAARTAIVGMRATFTLPIGVQLAAGNPAIALSPDGSRVVFAGASAGQTRLYVRQMNESEATPLAGSDGASAPFFSPDGRWIGFFSERSLKKLPVAGGAPVVVNPKVELYGSSGGAWTSGDTIVFTAGRGDAVSSLHRVSAETSDAAEIVRSDEAGNSLRWPHALPGGRGILFTHWGGSISTAQVVFTKLDGTQRRSLAQGNTFGRYAASGHLVIAREGVLLAARFDARRAEVSGPFVPVLEGVAMTPFRDAAQFAFSDTGTLVYLAGESGADSAPMVAWRDRNGNERAVAFDKRTAVHLSLSPDGKRLAVSLREGEGDVWVADLDRGSLTRVTFAPGEDETPQWSPDGARIAYASSRTGRPRLILGRSADGTGAEEELWTSLNHIHLSCWSADGKWLLFEESFRETGWDVWVLPLEGERKARPLLASPFNERSAVLSPNGRWLAYISNETGSDEVYVRSFPALIGKVQVSTAGGAHPRWAPDSEELFYASGAGLMSARVQAGAAFQVAQTQVVFEQASGEYCVGPGAERFLLRNRQEQRGLNQLQVITRWFDELKRRVP